jgi:hypothetical protein
MVEVAAHLSDSVLPPLPVRQWVLSLPKRLRPFLPRDPALAGAVLRILLRAVRTLLLKRSPSAPADAQLGAVSFLHRFGSALMIARIYEAFPLRCPSALTPIATRTATSTIRWSTRAFS